MELTDCLQRSDANNLLVTCGSNLALYSIMCY